MDEEVRNWICRTCGSSFQAIVPPPCVYLDQHATARVPSWQYIEWCLKNDEKAEGGEKL